MSDKPSTTLEKTIFLKVVRDYVMRRISQQIPIVPWPYSELGEISPAMGRFIHSPKSDPVTPCDSRNMIFA